MKRWLHYSKEIVESLSFAIALFTERRFRDHRRRLLLQLRRLRHRRRKSSFQISSARHPSASSSC
jgi:hypothetical protein